MPKKKMFIIDVMAMAYRSFHAFGAQQLTTSQGLPTSAIYGVCQFLLKLEESEEPDFIVAACDHRSPTFRHKMYEAYKAHRKPMPDDLSVQLPGVNQSFEAFGIKNLVCPGVEADDIIGTLVKRFASDDLHCYIVSGDKDLMQLIDSNVSMYSPKKGGLTNIIDEAGVQEKFGCAPYQVIDALALIGDSSDNVPGVKGIGAKGASRLITEFSSLEGIYQALDSIPNKNLRTKLENSRDVAFLSKQLVTLDCQVPLEISLEEISYNSQQLMTTTLHSFFTEMEFSGLAKRLPAISEASTQPTPLANNKQEEEQEEDIVSIKKMIAGNYQLINSPEALDQLLEISQKYQNFAFRIVATGTDIHSDRPVGLSICFEAGHGFYLPLIERQLRNLSIETVTVFLRDIFANDSTNKIAHDLKFDLQMLTKLAIEPVGPFADTMLMAFLLTPGARSFTLDHLAESAFNSSLPPIAALIGAKVGSKKQAPIDHVSLIHLLEHTCPQADCTLQLHNFYVPHLHEKKLWSLFEDMEMPLVPILARMEINGVKIDEPKLSLFSKHLAAMSATLESEIHAIAGEVFNIQSPKQLQRVLFESLKIHESPGMKTKKIKKTKSGYSTDVTVLEQLSDQPICAKLLEFRSVTKLLNTYVDALPALISESSGRIHTSFHQTGAATGRLSSSHPNLQNIPIRTELGRRVRDAFITKPDWILISADYSQIELRILAHLADDPVLKSIFAEGGDVHRTTAAKILGKDPAEVSTEERSRAKAINYGIVYGMGPKKLAKSTGVTLEQAKDFIARYFETFPNIRSFIEQSIEYARENGETRTLLGRLRPIEGLDGSLGALAEVNGRNIAVNSPIQGTAADLIKLAMILIDKQIHKQGLQARMLLQVHDELVLECPANEREVLVELVRTNMENALPMAVKLETTVGCGNNWLEAH